MATDRIYNFSAGPSMLPLPVLEQAASEMTNYRGSGMSVMEMSHRSKVYIDIFDETKADLRRLMKIPEKQRKLTDKRPSFTYMIASSDKRDQFLRQIPQTETPPIDQFTPPTPVIRDTTQPQPVVPPIKEEEKEEEVEIIIEVE